jgi:acetolactate decarboxylase
MNSMNTPPDRSTVRRALALFAFGLAALGAAARDTQLPGETLTQMGTIDALLAGNYDGTVPLTELVRHGDFGIGTFDHLDGEMLVLDGVIFQVRASGQVLRADMTGSTPYAAVCFFQGKSSLDPLRSLDLDRLKAAIDSAYPAGNVPLAIRIDGRFARIRTRSVPAQQRPYRPLAEVTKTQPEFEASDISGTLLGFRLPPFVKGINVPGYHLHFISADRSFGGHVLGFELASGKASIEEIRNLFVALPIDQPDYRKADLGKDRARELEQAESAKH